MLTADQVKKQFHERGETYSDWARRNGFRPGQVSRVLNGYEKCIRGDAHTIAVMLGLKTGHQQQPQTK